MQAGVEVTPTYAVAKILKGATLLKCGSMGSPHFREFSVSRDLLTLMWFSPNKNDKKTLVRIEDIKEIRLGQNTKNFKRVKRKEYDNLAFSVIYDDNKTLDIVCKDKRELSIWVIGLETLLYDRDSISLKDADNLHESDTIKLEYKGRRRTKITKREDSNDAYSWGKGKNGKLGHGNEEDQCIPKVIEYLLGKDIRGVCCGPGHSAAWNGNGEVFTWGAGGNGRLGHGHEHHRFVPLLVSALRGEFVVQVACGDYHTVVVTNEGKIFSWGKGSNGRLGLGHEDDALIPTEVGYLHEKMKFIACGYVTTAAITVEGSVYMWGGNDGGQLGTGDCETQLYPVKLECLADEEVVDISCGTFHTVALTSNGNVFTWGNGTKGKLGHGDEEEQLYPKLVESLVIETVTQVSCGDFHTAALGDLGVYTWGEGKHGQLGHGLQITNENTPLFLKIAAEGKIIQISCGSNHTAALFDNGHVYSWGYQQGESLENAPHPILLESMLEKKIRQISCGGSHSIALVIHGWVPDEESAECMAVRQHLQSSEEDTTAEIVEGFFATHARQRG
eukprot:CAMPEP_0174255280 /NCGR_PEP_ID=MMETSP0439-20130205/4627_1 /TAXON_ID=0 /ORGANISM="Stereomyxa ramosa, Strain Chinc5" /LENGTH=558 /DNA_ID=CAMNT_0015337397 /DNA_START=161 /DNA_END=1838 /DNA_ORIENTATION=+